MIDNRDRIISRKSFGKVSVLFNNLACSSLSDHRHKKSERKRERKRTLSSDIFPLFLSIEAKK